MTAGGARAGRSRPSAASPTSAARCDVLLLGFEGQENLGLRSVAAYLASRGVRVGIQPIQATPREQILERIRSERPRLVGFSLIFQRMLPDFAALVGWLRERRVAAHFTMGGHFPSFAPQEVFAAAPGLDTIVRHEGEETLLELFHAVDAPASWPGIAGLALRIDGAVRVNPARPLLRDLDALPFPVRDAVGVRHRGLGIRSLAASRGCWYDCSFCSIHEFYRQAPGPNRRARSPDHVVAEMRQLHDELGVRIFIFQDDDFLMRAPRHRRWVDELLAGLRTSGLADRILWRISCRVDDLDREALVRMRDAGLASVYLGIEAGSDQSLRTFHKRYRVADAYRALDVLDGIGLPYEFGFMIFDPDSTFRTLRENVEFLRRAGAGGKALVNFCKMAPYAGTPIARRLAAEGRLEGTTASPDYRFLDRRLDLLQLFLSRTFNFRNFDDAGLVERLRFAKFDACVVAKYFSDRWDAAAYARGVQALIRRANEVAVEALSLAANFVEDNPPERILGAWGVLQDLAISEARAEAEVSAALDQLMARYGFERGAAGGVEPTPRRHRGARAARSA